MATHSSILAWRISGTGEPGGLPSMGSHRVGHNWSDLAAAAASTCSVMDKMINSPWYEQHVDKYPCKSCLLNAFETICWALHSRVEFVCHRTCTYLIWLNPVRLPSIICVARVSSYYVILAYLSLNWIFLFPQSFYVIVNYVTCK